MSNNGVIYRPLTAAPLKNNFGFKEMKHCCSFTAISAGGCLLFHPRSCRFRVVTDAFTLILGGMEGPGVIALSGTAV